MAKESYEMTYEEYLIDCDRLAEKGGAFAAAYDREDHETNLAAWMHEIEEAIEDEEDDIPAENRTAYAQWNEATEPARERARKISAEWDADEERFGKHPNPFRGMAF